MNRIFIIFFTAILTLFSFNKSLAQVGIGTENPEGFLHIDAKKDNDNSTESTKYEDDIVINEEGKIGFGIKNPEGILHIDRLNNNDALDPNPARLDDDFIIYENGIKMGIKNPKGRATNPFVKIANGTEGEDKVLTSDAEGNASWKKMSSNIILGTKEEAQSIYVKDLISGYKEYLLMKITLPPGTWEVGTRLLFIYRTGYRFNVKEDGYLWLSATFAEEGKSETSEDVIMGRPSGAINIGNEKEEIASLVRGNSVLSGNTIIQNKTSNDKTYYLIVKDFYMSAELSTYSGLNEEDWIFFYSYGAGQSGIYAKRVSVLP